MQTLDTLTYDNLFAGNNLGPVTVPGTLLSGEGALTRGTVLGKVTATGKLRKVDSSHNDGSEVPYAVLAAAADSTSADVPCAVYLAGEFNEDALVFGGTDTKTTHRAALRDVGIFLKTTISVKPGITT